MQQERAAKEKAQLEQKEADRAAKEKEQAEKVAKEKAEVWIQIILYILISLVSLITDFSVYSQRFSRVCLLYRS